MNERRVQIVLEFSVSNRADVDEIEATLVESLTDRPEVMFPVASQATVAQDEDEPLHVTEPRD